MDQRYQINHIVSLGDFKDDKKVSQATVLFYQIVDAAARDVGFSVDVGTSLRTLYIRSGRFTKINSLYLARYLHAISSHFGISGKAAVLCHPAQFFTTEDRGFWVFVDFDQAKSWVVDVAKIEESLGDMLKFKISVDKIAFEEILISD